MKRIKIIALAAVLLGSGAAFATKSPSHKFLTQFANTGTTTTHWILQTRMPGSTTGKYSCENDVKPCTSYFTNAPGNPPADGTPEQSDAVYGAYTVH